MHAHHERTKYERFTSDLLRSSFKKLIVSTPRLLRNLHTMSLAKAVPDGLKDCKCMKMALREYPPIPNVPENDSVQETVSPSRTKISRPCSAKVWVCNHKFLSGILELARLSSFMWDLLKKRLRKKDILIPTRNLPNL